MVSLLTHQNSELGLHGDPQHPAFGSFCLNLCPYLYCPCQMFRDRKIGPFPRGKDVVAAVVPDYNCSTICLWACFWLPIKYH